MVRFRGPSIEELDFLHAHSVARALMLQFTQQSSVFNVKKKKFVSYRAGLSHVEFQYLLSLMPVAESGLNALSRLQSLRPLVMNYKVHPTTA
jgi:hypothetical protein